MTNRFVDQHLKVTLEPQDEQDEFCPFDISSDISFSRQFSKPPKSSCLLDNPCFHLDNDIHVINANAKAICPIPFATR